jgi:hypothetical protein
LCHMHPRPVLVGFFPGGGVESVGMDRQRPIVTPSG